MGVTLGLFASVVALAAPTVAHAFLLPVTSSRLSPRTAGRRICGRSATALETSKAESAAAAPQDMYGRYVGVGSGSCRRGGRWASATAATAVDGGSDANGGGEATAVDGGSDANGGGEATAAGGGVARSEGQSAAAATTAPRTPVEPVGAAGAMEDDMLIQLVGQDYGMMALLRNDKFKGLIVLLRNIPPNEWVAEVAKAYPDDDEVKGMLGQVGKLMRMMDYYEAKKPKKK